MDIFSKKPKKATEFVKKATKAKKLQQWQPCI